jgi:hypothetical protein
LQTRQLLLSLVVQYCSNNYSQHLFKQKYKQDDNEQAGLDFQYNWYGFGWSWYGVSMTIDGNSYLVLLLVFFHLFPMNPSLTTTINK